MRISLFYFPLSATELTAHYLHAHLYCDLQDAVAFLASVPYRDKALTQNSIQNPNKDPF